MFRSDTSHAYESSGPCVRLGRRAWLKSGSLVLAATALDSITPAPLYAADTPGPAALRIGLITDLHYADKPAAGSRFYRETIDKLAEAARRFVEEKPAFVMELGDLIDAADSVETEQRWLSRINRDYSAIAVDRHYVLGNHCVDILTKEEFLGGVERDRAYYSFDRGGFHFVILDACFRGDGQPYGRKNFHWTDPNIPSAELEWLTADLKATDRRTIVFVHQRLDVSDDHGVKNAPEVRRVLESSGRVLAVFQGHSHENDYREINGIHYTVLRAMVEGSGAENNGYSLLAIQPEGTLRLAGFRQQRSFSP
jgi:UDP-2,3-diacylglucosamine pyrophosphatase LpxH